MTTQDEFTEVIVRIGAGNPGAMSVMTKISKEMPSVDFGFLIAALEHHKIFGPKLWCAYKDYANGNVDIMARQGRRTYVRQGTGEWGGWIVVTQSGKSTPVAYFMELTDRCVC